MVGVRVVSSAWATLPTLERYNEYGFVQGLTG